MGSAAEMDLGTCAGRDWSHLPDLGESLFRDGWTCWCRAPGARFVFQNGKGLEDAWSMMSIPPLREWDGAMTRELLREPGRFGLGQVPTSMKPVSVAKAICGFCATGCGLKVHLDSQGQAINVTPDPEYPVNLGMACPKGWEALTPLWSDDRGTTPLHNGKAVGWGEALEVFCDRFKEVQAKHGARSTAFLSTGQIMVEEMEKIVMLVT